MVAWQKADRLASLVYRACKMLPRGNDWLFSQTVRCAISVPANLAEGHAKGSQAEFRRFVDIARGSLAELEYYLHFMENESLLDEGRLTALKASQIETSKIVLGLWRSLKASPKRAWDQGNRIAEQVEQSEIYSAI